MINLMPFKIALLALLFTVPPSFCLGQLRVLSEGNIDEPWRKSQIASLSRQLEEASAGSLREELKAQQEWLEAWTPGALTVKPLWKSEVQVKRLLEPVIDPKNLASELRRRLLGPKARPTVKDTQALEQLLREHPQDMGVRQLHLHWLDQRQYRKTYPDAIAKSALVLAGMLEHAQPQTDELRAARAHCLYRYGRALAYRELPDVQEKTPIEDPDRHSAELLGAFTQLIELVGRGRPEFILLEIRMLRRDGWLGRALVLLENHGSQIEPQWFLKKRRDLLEELGWSAAHSEAAEIYAKEFPEAVEAENDG